MEAQIREGLQSLPLADIQLSATAAQTERRKHFDKDAIAELADSIKTVGLINPITVRPVNGHYELVAGERRFLAAKEAKLSSIVACIRDLSDELVLEVQLIENLQREGLHELAEAEGYEQLHKLGHSAEEIAHKVGKSKAYVYARMKLLALGPAAREAFYRGDISASIALLLARMPDPASQREAVGEITNPQYGSEPMSFRQARDHLEREYMLRLADAPFDTKDAQLLPKAGACGPCVKRTGNQAELFSDIKSGDVCTDPACFKLKREAWSKRQLQQAKESGRKVIAGAEANAIARYGFVSNGYARLNETCYEDEKSRTFKTLTEKNPELVQLLQMPKTGEIIEVVNKNEAVKAARKAGIIEATANRSPYGTAVKKPVDKEKAAVTAAMIDRLLVAIHAKAPKQLDRKLLLELVNDDIDHAMNLPQGFFTAWGWDADSFDKVPKLSAPELQQLIYEIRLIESMPSDPDMTLSWLTKEAKRLGVDLKKLKASSAAAAPKAAAATKKKAKSKK